MIVQILTSQEGRRKALRNRSQSTGRKRKSRHPAVTSIVTYDTSCLPESLFLLIQVDKLGFPLLKVSFTYQLGIMSFSDSRSHHGGQTHPGSSLFCALNNSPGIKNTISYPLTVIFTHNIHEPIRPSSQPIFETRTPMTRRTKDNAEDWHKQQPL